MGGLLAGQEGGTDDERAERDKNWGKKKREGSGVGLSALDHLQGQNCLPSCHTFVLPNYFHLALSHLSASYRIQRCSRIHNFRSF